MTTHHSASADPALEFFGSVSSALVLTCVRSFGETIAGEVERIALGRTIDENAGLLDIHEAGAPYWAAAERSVQWAILSGRKAAVIPGPGDHAFVIELPPSQLSDGPYEPSTSIARVGDELARAWSTAQADAVLRLLGNPPVSWVSTHSQAAGDMIDAGYFSPSGTPPVPLPDASALLNALPASDAPPRPSPSVVHHLLLARFQQRLAAMVELIGVAEAATTTRLALSIVLAARWDWMAIAGYPGSEFPAVVAAHRYQMVQGWLDTQCDVVGGSDGGVALRDHPSEQWTRLTAALPTFREVWLEAWSAAARCAHIDLALTDRGTTITVGDLEFSLP